MSVVKSSKLRASESKRIVYVLSTPRAGSTLLKSMLDAHSDVFAPAELHLWPYDCLQDAQRHLKHTTLANGLVECLIRLLGSEAMARGTTPRPAGCRYGRIRCHAL